MKRARILATFLVGLGLTGLLLATPALAKPDPQASALAAATEALARGDYPVALKLLAPLAAGGSAEAQYRLGDLFYKGQGVAQDYLTAGQWYARAAEQLDTDWAAEAQVNLGIMHGLGQGRAVDGVGALMWMEIAAACGSDLALQDRELFAARLTPVDAQRARGLARDWLRARGR
jgi:TPR repeat protein